MGIDGVTLCPQAWPRSSRGCYWRSHPLPWILSGVGLAGEWGITQVLGGVPVPLRKGGPLPRFKGALGEGIRGKRSEALGFLLGWGMPDPRAAGIGFQQRLVPPLPFSLLGAEKDCPSRPGGPEGVSLEQQSQDQLLSVCPASFLPGFSGTPSSLLFLCVSAAWGVCLCLGGPCCREEECCSGRGEGGIGLSPGEGA